MKYKGVYRVLPNIDLTTNDIPRDVESNIDKTYDDIYIKCAQGTQIYHYGGSTLVVYIPSIGRGHNVLKAIYEENIGGVNKHQMDNKFDYDTMYQELEQNKIVFEIEDTEAEVIFKFLDKNMTSIIKHLKPQTSGAKISPFSAKNLPKATYTIDADDLREYKKISEGVPKENLLILSRLNNEFLTTVASELLNKIDIKADMKLQCLKGKEYIHSKGETLWKAYLQYLKSELENI